MRLPEGTRSLTEQVSAGDAPLGDGGLHGADGGGEDVGLLEDLGQLRAVQGAEGRGVVLLGALIELQRGELVAPGLGVPVLVLWREEEGAAWGSAAGSAGKGNVHAKARPGRKETTSTLASFQLPSLLTFQSSCT